MKARGWRLHACHIHVSWNILTWDASRRYRLFKCTSSTSFPFPFSYGSYLTGCLLQVDLYESGTIAIVEAVSPELGNRVQRVRVQLPGTSQELLTKFREKKVDFAAHTATEDGGAVFLNLLGMAVTVFSTLLHLMGMT